VWAEYWDYSTYWLIPGPPSVYTLDRKLNLDYTCDPGSGQLLRVTGPAYSGSGTKDHLLTAGISYDDAFDYFNPNMHYVDVNILGAIGYGGAVEEYGGLTVGPGPVQAAIGFNTIEEWGQHFEWDNYMRLACKKGSA
jgi:hypothetical protein